MKLKQGIMIRNKNLKNRVVLPPLVCFNWADDQGYETVSRADHYGRIAAGGTGLIVVEATAILPEGRIIDTELGLWEDGHIDQFSALGKACHAHGSLVLVQLVHAGEQAVGQVVKSSSAMDHDKKTVVAMTLEDIEAVKNAFVCAALRAKQAGLDGVEIHGAHGYLLSQFTSAKRNHRQDDYGLTLEGRHRLSIEVVSAVRRACGEDFIIGYRYGVNDPTFEEDAYFAKALEAAGVDMFNVSSGILTGPVTPAEDYKEHWVTYLGSRIKALTGLPVASVYGMRTGDQAQWLVDNNHTDLVAVGRGILADPEWANKVFNHQEVNLCYHCQPRCKYGVNGNQCPWRLKGL